MVNYEYRNLFYKTHQKKDILIVDSGATVTAVSGEAPSIAGATVEIHTDDVKIESFTLDESICSEEDLKFGLCESSRLGLTIRNRTDIPKLKDFDGYFNVYIYFNGDSDTLFQVGQYICVTDEYTNNRKQRDLEFYDLMHELYDLDITPWYDSYFSDGQRHQIFFAIADLFLWIRGDSPYDSDEDSPHIPVEIDTNFTLTNGDFPFGKNIESDTVTFGFFMEGVLEFNGCFGHMSRDGKFRMILLEWYDKDPVRTVTDEYRIPPTNYDDVATWGIGRINVYSRDNIKMFSHTNSEKKHPSTYVMVDPWILADREKGDTTVQTALERFQTAIYHTNYTPNETECSGDLCVEVGDRINIVFGNPAPEDTRSRLRSYVLERHLKGFGSMKDTYTAKGHKKQPKYQIPNERWHNGDSTSSSTQGQGGVSEVDNEEDRKLIAKQRNYGEPMLDEPSAVEVVYNKTTQQVEITWTDPDDISSYTPKPIEWAGTVVVRKESTPPLHPFGNIDSYGGTVLVDETVKDTYKTTAYVDNTIEPNKKYYYAIMPYFIALNDEYHPIKHYRWTKCISVDTERVLMAPTIYPITNIEGTDATIVYMIPHLLDATYTVRKMVGKKNSIPASISDGDIVVDVTESQTIPYVSSVEITGLDENSIYYFVLFVEDSLGATASSDAQECTSGENSKLILIDSYNNYHNPIVDLNDVGYITTNGDITYYRYQEDGTFICHDQRQAQAKCVFNTKMRKGTATKLFIECTTRNVYSYPDFGFGLMSTMPTAWGYPQGGDRGTVLKWLYDFANTTKGTYELSLDDISADSEFYIIFYMNSTESVIYKTWFNGEPIICAISDLRYWTKNQSDSVINIKKIGDEETVVINPVVDWEHIVYEATVEKNKSYSFIYDAKCTSGSRSYTANQMAAYILSSNPGSDASWWHYSIISENGGSLNNLGNSYQTFTTTFNSGNRTKVWIAINYSAISDSEHDVTFVYKNVRLVQN